MALLGVANLNTRNKSTLEAIFEQPTRADIRWNDVDRLLRALGAERVERKGSRVAFILNDRPMVLHRPHPGSEISKGMVETVRDGLSQSSIRPEE